MLSFFLYIHFYPLDVFSNSLSPVTSATRNSPTPSYLDQSYINLTLMNVVNPFSNYLTKQTVFTLSCHGEVRMGENAICSPPSKTYVTSSITLDIDQSDLNNVHHDNAFFKIHLKFKPYSMKSIFFRASNIGSRYHFFLRLQSDVYLLYVDNWCDTYLSTNIDINKRAYLHVRKGLWNQEDFF